IVIIFNPLTIDRNEIVCLQSSNSENIHVKDSFNDNILPVQINPVIYKDRDRMQISFTVVELCWMASIPALSLKRYVLSSDKEVKDSLARKSTIITNFGTSATSNFNVNKFESDVFRVENEYFMATFSSATGYLKVMQLKNQAEVNLNIDFAKYGTTNDKDKSGAYLFLPDGDAKELPSLNHKVLLIQGHLFTLFQYPSYRRNFAQAVSCRSLELQNLVDITREENFELVMRLKTGIKNEDNTFFTDLNGFQIIKRKYFSKIPHQGNVYPMPTAAYLEDKNFRLTLLSGQPNGVVSSNTGQFEVFLDRRLMQDDNRGLFQSITDNKITPNVFKLVFESLSEEEIDNNRKTGHHTLLSHLSSLSLLYPLLIMFDNVENEQSKLDLLSSKRFIRRSFPCDLHLINLRTLQEKQDYNDSGDSSSFKSSQDYNNLYPNVRTKSELGLILHRFSYDCKARNQNLAECSKFFDKDNQHNRIFSTRKQLSIQRYYFVIILSYFIPLYAILVDCEPSHTVFQD
uniref:Glycosyl hydrolase family 38 C-terminal domain-containing protein n=1 Tax=Romanomermis culicivorax TaxID=13658 RepID=A0A915HMT6_ROMCU